MGEKGAWRLQLQRVGLECRFPREGALLHERTRVEQDGACREPEAAAAVLDGRRKGVEDLADARSDDLAGRLVVGEVGERALDHEGGSLLRLIGSGGRRDIWHQPDQPSDERWRERREGRRRGRHEHNEPQHVECGEEVRRRPRKQAAAATAAADKEGELRGGELVGARLEGGHERREGSHLRRACGRGRATGETPQQRIPQWVRSGSAVSPQWLRSESAVGSQWVCGGSGHGGSEAMGDVCEAKQK